MDSRSLGGGMLKTTRLGLGATSFGGMMELLSVTRHFTPPSSTYFRTAAVAASSGVSKVGATPAVRRGSGTLTGWEKGEFKRAAWCGVDCELFIGGKHAQQKIH